MGKTKKTKNREVEIPPGAQSAANRSIYRMIPVAGIALAAGLLFVFRDAKAINTTNPTFAEDIAPLIHSRCATCHHPGGAGPFDLLTFSDVSKRAADIVKVTQKRTMPPWLPEPGYGDFEGDRRLSDDEVLMLKNWVAQGAPQGNPARIPPAPKFESDWQLGKPDLVVQMPKPYILPAEGRDVYRNFVIPIPLTEDKLIKGMEFRADSSRIHHAFMYVDATPASRRRDGKDGQPGWLGMGLPSPTAQTPSAQFTSWQPGKRARMHEDMAWRLSKGTDLVLQLHMQTSGKAEPIQPAVAFYFADRPGSKQPAIILLRSVDLDIPAGEKAFIARAQYKLPVDCGILGVLPHVHYLGKDLKGYATLPDGSRKWLLWIKDWDFNWQGDYAYKQPVSLPKGSIIEMEYTFDNSAENPRNPNQPPKPVHFGLNSTDEMCELWLQLLPRNPADAAVLQRDRDRIGMLDLFALNAQVLRHNPDDAHAHLALGRAFLFNKDIPKAEAHLRRAVQLDERNSEVHYYLGYFFGETNKVKECLAEFRRAVQLDPQNHEALNALGWTLYSTGNAREAEAVLAEALRLNPNDPKIQENLSEVRRKLGK